jgi:NitT/TauT family transport system ATP-binding protein
MSMKTEPRKAGTVQPTEQQAANEPAMTTGASRTLGRSGATITVDHVSHAFALAGGEDELVLDQVSFEIPSGEFVALVGPSGCGKTTVLNFMAGLIAPLSGQVVINGDVITRPTRHTGYMFARDALLPWRTAIANVESGLEIRRVAAKERRERAQNALDLVGLGSFAQHYPKQLSQGMRQRVAVARTLAMDPDTLLMDEPFAALDAQTRIRVQGEFTRIWENSNKTVVLVTHDLSEAVLMADRVIVLAARPGRIVADIAIDLERPRDVEELRFSTRFLELNSQVYEALKKGEVS